MRLALAITTTLALATTGVVPKANAEPLVTISCDKPNGFNIAYGTSFGQRLEAEQKKQPEPPPALTGPNKDGYVGTTSFIIDSNKERMTIIWAELPEDIKLRKQAKEHNLPMIHLRRQVKRPS
jgi:hypothetical protein